jgi:hypothetical protein
LTFGDYAFRTLLGVPSPGILIRASRGLAGCAPSAWLAG